MQGLRLSHVSKKDPCGIDKAMLGVSSLQTKEFCIITCTNVVHNNLLRLDIGRAISIACVNVEKLGKSDFDDLATSEC